ncbi:MAG: glycosidase [Bacteroidales bacterium]|nr:glycosidase [Bacteroidales bacterium]MBN2762286.1 glycosidase [Bacteroidales bacterium]
MKLIRCNQNPIIIPGKESWRKVVTFNPGVLYDDGKFYLYERAAGSLRPFRTFIGLHESTDGIHFKLVSEKPVFSSEMLGLPEGSVQDARVVKIENKYYMCFALQPYGFDCLPTGEGVPDYPTEKYPEWEKMPYPMITQSGIAVSFDRINFRPLCYTSSPNIDDRDHVLFPEKIRGKFALLRRPMEFVGEQYGTRKPGIWLSYSDELLTWKEPKLLAVAQNSWEGTKIGAAASPVRTSEGWLLLYHGVDDKSVYRVGAMLLDLVNPLKVIARTKHFIMEPETYYEKFGLVIPNVVFPTGNVIKDGILYIYYGCCDSNISLATVPVDELIDYILNEQ